MKKSLLVLTAALTFGSMASAQTNSVASAPQVPAMADVPAGHWAKDAIDRLVSKGILLGYPDGTFRGTQNLTRYEAAVIIARLLDQINTGAVAAPAGDDLTALQNAVQELAADLAALGVRVSDLEENAVSKDDFSRLEARVEELGAATGNQESLDKLQAMIDDLTARADDYDTLRADVDDNASSIAALNDLTVLLNQDILDLQDRVSAVEAAQADFVQRSDFDNLSGKVTAIDTRVTKLENAPKFTVSGTIDARYGNIGLTNGISLDPRWNAARDAANALLAIPTTDPRYALITADQRAYAAAFVAASQQGPNNFDVDRLTRQTFADGAFSSNVGGSPANCIGGLYAFNGVKDINCTDTNYGSYMNDGGISFGVKASNLVTANGKIVVNNAAINFGTDNAFNVVGADGKMLPVAVKIGDASADGTINGQKFDVSYHASRSSFKFNDYLFANDNANEGSFTPTYRRGVVANIEATQLPFAPKLTIVLGNAARNPNGIALPGTVVDANGNNIVTAGSGGVPGFAGNYYGVRASINPMNVGTVGLAFAQNDGNRSAIGADWDLGFGDKDKDGNAMFKVNGVGVASLLQSQSTFTTNQANSNTNVVQNAWNNADKAFYVEGRANLSMVKFGAQYHSIAPAFANGVAGMSVNDAPYYSDCGFLGAKTSMPYCYDEKGYGFAAATNIGPVLLEGYYDHTNDYANTAASRDNTFGIAAGVKFRGLKAVGFYNARKKNDVAYDSTSTSSTKGPVPAADAYYLGISGVPYGYNNTYGAVLTHDGTAADALVKNLNFTVADGYFYHAKINDFQIYGDYNGTFAGVTIAPFARYHVLTTPDDGTTIPSYNTIKYGVKLSTQPFTTVPLQPSAYVNFAQRKTTVKSDATDGSNVVDETFVQAGVSLNRFLADNLKASVGYSYYKGTHVNNMLFGTSNNTFSTGVDRLYSSPGNASVFAGSSIGGQTGKIDGIYAQADWNGLQVNYGIFRYYNLNPIVVDAVKTATNGAADPTTLPMSVAQAFKVSYTFKF